MANTIVLMPGEIFFSQQKVKVKTLLGSCVAIVLWHPQKQLGGMCHFVLPSRSGTGPLDARYANDAMQMFINEMALHKTRPHEYQAWLYGGANMFSNLAKECRDHDTNRFNRCQGCKSVACSNRITARELIKKHELVLVESDLGGHQHRQVEFNLGVGKPILRHNPMTASVPTVRFSNGLER